MSRHDETPRRERLVPALTVCAILFLLLCVAAHLRTCVQLVRLDSPDLWGEEDNVVYSIERLRAGGPLYSDPSSAPFAITQYSPGYYYLTAGLASALGVPVDDALGNVRAGRWLSFACLLGQSAVVALLLRRHAQAAWPMVIVGAIWTLAVQTPSSIAARPDSLEVLLIMMSLALGLESFRRADDGRPSLWLAGALLAGADAALVKQSGAVAGLILLPPALVFLGPRRTLLAGCLAAVPAAALAALLLAFSGPAIKANLIDGVNNGVSIPAALHQTYVPYFERMAALVAGAVGLSLYRPWKGRDPREALLSWGAAATFAFATATALKVGSSPNYYLAFNLIAALLVVRGVSAGLSAEGDRRPRAQSLGQLILLAYAALWVPSQSYALLNKHSRPERTYATSQEVTERVRQLLAGESRDVKFFSQDSRLDTQLPAHAVVPQKLLASFQFNRRVVDYSAFAAAVRDGTVRYCITYNPGSPAVDLFGSFRTFVTERSGVPDPNSPSFLGASFADFDLVERIGPHAIYKKRPRGD